MKLHESNTESLSRGVFYETIDPSLDGRKVIYEAMVASTILLPEYLSIYLFLAIILFIACLCGTPEDWQSNITSSNFKISHS